jgi:hypothetical protein
VATHLRIAALTSGISSTAGTWPPHTAACGQPASGG